jgi:hypothetical protein
MCPPASLSRGTGDKCVTNVASIVSGTRDRRYTLNSTVCFFVYRVQYALSPEISRCMFPTSARFVKVNAKNPSECDEEFHGKVLGRWLIYACLSVGCGQERAYAECDRL